MICTSLSLLHIAATVSPHAYYLCQSCQGHDERNWEPSQSRHSEGCQLPKQQPHSVSMGTLLWPPGCGWRHLMYVFRDKKKSLFLLEILNNTGKLKPLSRLTLRHAVTTESLRRVRKLRDRCEEWLKMIVPNLLIFPTSSYAIVKNRRMLCTSTKTIMWKIWWRWHSWTWETHTHTQTMQNSRREKSDNKDSKDRSNLNSNLLKNTVRLYSNFPETRGFNLKRWMAPLQVSICAITHIFEFKRL